MKKIKTALIQFPEVNIEHNKIASFRSEVIKLVDREDDIFHNHTVDGGIIARYPKIQFRVMNNSESGRDCATVWAVESGIMAMLELLIVAGDLKYTVDTKQTEVGIINTKKTYRLNHFIPFNDNNWLAYQEARSIRQRLTIIERALIGNLLNFCADLGYRIPDRGLTLEILDYKELGLKHCPTDKKDDLYLMAFDVIYETNLNIPQYAGLGRFKTKGYGWQTGTDMCKIPQPKRNRMLRQISGQVATEEKN